MTPNNPTPELERYEFALEHQSNGKTYGYAVPSINGDYVLHSEAAATIARLTAERDDLHTWNEKYKGDLEVLCRWHKEEETRAKAAEKRVKELEAQNERLVEKGFDLIEERDLARNAIAWANNSLFGSHGYFLSLNGGEPDPHHLDRPIENLKASSNRAEASNKLLSERVAVLEGALEPFKVELFNDFCPDETPAWYFDDEDNSPSPVTVGDFRRARTVGEK